jgi:hypothetical protein
MPDLYSRICQVRIDSQNLTIDLESQKVVVTTDAIDICNMIDELANILQHICNQAGVE